MEEGWAVAIATEANLLLEIGKHQEAKELLAVEVPQFKQVAERWGQALINADTTNKRKAPQMKQNSAKSGSIDESERAFGATEKAIAEFLEREGKNVKALAEKNDGGRNPDAEVDGKPTEFKSLDFGATSATVKNQINNSIRRGGQARDIIIDARKSGLIESEAERGLQRAKNITRGKIDCVRIIGDRYDITFTEFQ